VSGILWLASYPKSGNTWLRIFLANLRRNDDLPVDINSGDIDRHSANERRIFDDATGVEASELTAEEITNCRPGVFRYLARTSAKTVFLKVHDAYTILPGGKTLIPSDVTTGAVYIVRNPLAVAVSFADYSAVTVDRMIEIMASDYTYDHKPSLGILNERLLSWSDHLLSWCDRPPFPVHVVRYEDMHERPLETFTAIAEFCGLSTDSAQVERALRHSSFERLQEQEREFGFREKPESAPSFFREGKTDAWRQVLSESQITAMVDRHGAVMRRFGYLPL
jgi:aryl sulfotransferase